MAKKAVLGLLVLILAYKIASGIVTELDRNNLITHHRKDWVVLRADSPAKEDNDWMAGEYKACWFYLDRADTNSLNCYAHFLRNDGQAHGFSERQLDVYYHGNVNTVGWPSNIPQDANDKPNWQCQMRQDLWKGTNYLDCRASWGDPSAVRY